MLGEGFKHAERFGLVTGATREEIVEKWRPKGPRRVRTLAGMKVFGQPIGTIITRDMIERARREGKLKGAAQRYERYADRAPTGRAGAAPARGARGAAKPARAAGRAAAKAPARAGGRAPAPKGDDFEAKVKRASYKDVLAMIDDLEADEDLDDKEFNRRLDVLLARGRQLRPNKETKAPPKKTAPPRQTKREAAVPARPKQGPAAGRRIDNAADRDAMVARNMDAANRLKEKAVEPAKPAPKPEKTEDEVVAEVFREAIAEAENEDDLMAVSRYLGAEQMSLPLKAKLRDEIAAKRKTMAKPIDSKGQVMGPSFHDLNARLQTAEKALMRTDQRNVEALLADVERDMKGRGLNQAQKAHLAATIASIRARMSMKSRSVKYGGFVERILEAQTVKDFAELDNEISVAFAARQLNRSEGESLVVQLDDRMDLLGLDPSEMQAPGAALDPDEWDTHPSKINPPKFKHDARASKYLSTRRELKQTAEVIRRREQRELAPDKTPAGKFLAAGGNIEDLTNPDGLLEYLRFDNAKGMWDRRFEITKVTSGGQGTAFTVKDTETDRRYFFKPTLNGQPNARGLSVEMLGEAVNEVVSGKFGQAVPAVFADTNFASTVEAGVQPVIQMTHLNEHAKKHFKGDVKTVEFDAEDRWTLNASGEMIPNTKVAAVRDPKNPLAIHIFDFLTNNTDRHFGNYAQVVHNDGTVSFVAVDNGAAFRGFDSFRKAEIPDHFLDSPEIVGYAEWAAFYNQSQRIDKASGRGFVMTHETREGYRAAGGGVIDQKQVERDAASLLKSFASMSPEQIRAELLKRFPDMADYDRAHLDSAVAILQNRIKSVTARDIARFISTERDIKT